MGIGLGIVLLLVGLILALDVVDLPASIDDDLDSNTLGWILIIVGVLAIVLALVMNTQRTRAQHGRRGAPRPASLAHDSTSGGPSRCRPRSGRAAVRCPP